METVTLYNESNAVIIVNKCDVDKYKALGFSTKKNTPKAKEKAAEPAKPVDEKPKADETADEKKRTKK